MARCNEQVTLGVRRLGSTPVYGRCGDTGHYGSKVHCSACETQLQVRYPQGWRFYPGDVCEHGAYVGGCGADHICGYCEEGVSVREVKSSRLDAIKRELQRWIEVVKKAAADAQLSDADRSLFYSCLPHTRACEAIVQRFGGQPTFSLGDTAGNYHTGRGSW